VSAPLLAVRGLELARGPRPILRGVDLELAAGEICTLMGLSGAGKSTVLRSVAALEAFGAGSITVDGVALRPGPVPKESRLRELRARVGMVFQAHALFEHLTALENVMLAPVHALRWPREKARQVALAQLENLGVLHRADAYPRQLSGGEAQRVSIARALAPDPRLLLLDEPTSALDPARRGALGETLRALASQGRTLLVTTHDVDFAHDFADRVVILSEGVVVEQGPARRGGRLPARRARRSAGGVLDRLGRRPAGASRPGHRTGSPGRGAGDPRAARGPDRSAHGSPGEPRRGRPLRAARLPAGRARGGSLRPGRASPADVTHALTPPDDLRGLTAVHVAAWVILPAAGRAA
jgi:ABC-type polar amino acid transport system ATPase subunit